MEIVPYLLDVLLFVFALYWSAANAAAKPGTPSFGLFRYKEGGSEVEKAKAKAPPPGVRRLMLK